MITDVERELIAIDMLARGIKSYSVSEVRRGKNSVLVQQGRAVLHYFFVNDKIIDVQVD